MLQFLGKNQNKTEDKLKQQSQMLDPAISLKSSERSRLLNIEQGVEYRNEFAQRNKDLLDSAHKPLVKNTSAKVQVDSQGKILPFDISPMKYEFASSQVKDSPYRLSVPFKQLKPHPNAENPNLIRLRGIMRRMVQNMKRKKRLDKLLLFKDDQTFEGYDNLKSKKRETDDAFMALSGYNILLYFWDMLFIYIVMANLYDLSLL